MRNHNSIIAQTAILKLIVRGLLTSDVELDVMILADRSGLDSAHWRDALHRLAGSGLIERSGESHFTANGHCEIRFRHLLDWQERLARLATARRPRARGGKLPSLLLGPQGAGCLFVGVARSTNSASLEQAMRQVTNRLAPYRASEADVLRDVAAETRALEDDLHAGDPAHRLAAIARYHQRRRRAAPLLVEAARHRKTAGVMTAARELQARRAAS